MAQSFSSIETYIAVQPKDVQNKLWDIHNYIIAIAPKETTTAISYQMPTYRYHGNLIHFALNKNHIGIYPGSDAIAANQQLLEGLKCTKGAVQIPITAAIPKKIIKAFVTHNVAILKNKKGPNWHATNNNWNEAYKIMDEIINSIPDLNKEHKWGNDIYTYKGKNLCAWHGFAKFFSIWFYNGIFMNDPYKVLISASEGKTKSLRQWRFVQAEDIDKNKLIEYINDAKATIDQVKQITPTKTIKKVVEPSLNNALNENKVLKNAFEKLTIAKQNEYCSFIEEAKQEKTKLSRITKITPLIINGKGLHDQYKK